MIHNTPNIFEFSDSFLANVPKPYQLPPHDALYVLQAPGVLTIKPEGGTSVSYVQGLGYRDYPNEGGQGFITCDTAGTVKILVCTGGVKLNGLVTPGVSSSTTPVNIVKALGAYRTGDALPNESGLYPVLGGMRGLHADGTSYNYPMRTRAMTYGYMARAQALSVAPVGVSWVQAQNVNTMDGVEESTMSGRFLVVEFRGTTGDGSYKVYGGLGTGITASASTQLRVYDRNGARLASDIMPTSIGWFFVRTSGMEFFKLVKQTDDGTPAGTMNVSARYDKIPGCTED